MLLQVENIESEEDAVENVPNITETDDDPGLFTDQAPTASLSVKMMQFHEKLCKLGARQAFLDMKHKKILNAIKRIPE